ncbi:hypothetical protein BTA51_01110 [Hahella sp. CCB-MM4]|uniref:hypothetical protein n=1 Tax=Hahella sp. (strain CCB-MM4) TaxID=1926491 RepID=UPI000BD2F78C|nr:hypothetical protein [Hahella sp. CCB-MM4]OZG75031.1 hypothetical protein BTA51_01110 [Hahella sp. CCB-MM4]
MRFFLIVCILISMVFCLKRIEIEVPAMVILTGFIVILQGPYVVGFIRRNEIKARCKNWLTEQGYQYKYVDLNAHMLSKGRLRWRASDAQLIFSIKNCEEEEFWFACGNWWLGTYIGGIKVYQVRHGKIVQVAVIRH